MPKAEKCRVQEEARKPADETVDEASTRWLGSRKVVTVTWRLVKGNNAVNGAQDDDLL